MHNINKQIKGGLSLNWITPISPDSAPNSSKIFSFHFQYDAQLIAVFFLEIQNSKMEVSRDCSSSDDKKMDHLLSVVHVEIYSKKEQGEKQYSNNDSLAKKGNDDIKQSVKPSAFEIFRRMSLNCEGALKYFRMNPYYSRFIIQAMILFVCNQWRYLSERKMATLNFDECFSDAGLIPIPTSTNIFKITQFDPANPKKK